MILADWIEEIFSVSGRHDVSSVQTSRFAYPWQLDSQKLHHFLYKKVSGVSCCCHKIQNSRKKQKQVLGFDPTL